MNTPKKARRLKAIAEWINLNRPELRAVVEKSSYHGDGHIAGTRLSRGVKGKKGNRLKVFWAGYAYLDRPIFDHNAAETYRTNDEIEDWLSKYLDGCVRGVHYASFGGVCDTCRREFK